MRYAIETAPKNGNIVILEDDESGFLEVAHWSPEAGEWIRENGERIEINPSHWHPCYSFSPFSSSDVPQPSTVDDVVSLRSAAAVDAASAPSRAWRGFAIPWNVAKVIAAVLIGIFLLQAVLHAHALNEERARSSALESELVAARRETAATSVVLSSDTKGDDTKGDNVSPPKVVDSATPELPQSTQQEPSRKFTAMEDIPAAAKQPESSLPESSKPEIRPSEPIPPKRRAVSQNIGYGCQHYRTYDPASATYKGYDGQRHSCP
jgi:hypothetical protein